LATRPSPEDFLRILRQIQGITKVIIHLVFSLIRFKGDKEKASQPYKGVVPLSAEDIAEMIFWTCTLPRHININRMSAMPVMQAFGPLAVKRQDGPV